MKKCIFLFVILNICAISTLHSQWLEKEGYWELEQNYGQLRDIKLNESTNELWIVTADNQVIAIDAETGLEIKRCECEIENTPFSAHISTDFNSVSFVVQKSNQALDRDSILYYTFEIKKCNPLFNYSVTVNNENNGIISPSSNFIDYINSENLFIVSLGINKRWFDGPNDLTSIFGDLKIFKFENNKLNLLDSIGKPLNHIKYSKNKNSTFYGTVLLSLSKSWTNSGGGSSFRDSNFIAEYNYLSKQYKELFHNAYGGSRNTGETQYFGQYYELDKIIEKNKDNYLVNSYRTLLTYDSKTNKFIDSIFFKYGLNDFMIHPNNEILFYSEYKNINSLLFSNKKSIDSVTYPFGTIKLIYDNSNLNIILYCSDQKIRYISPDILKPIPEIGFISDKSLIHTGEKIQFNAICNIDSCEYEWQFIPDGNITKTESKEIEFEYSQPGTYNVKLTIITPDGERHEFLKEKIIKVIDKPKADFSYELLNDELPLKVQFTDLSKGELIDWSWDFGDGNTSAELSPIHEYKFPGDFSVSLIVKDTLGGDTLIKYEIILIQVKKPKKIDALNFIINKNAKFEFRSSSLATDRFHIISGSILVEYDGFLQDYEYSNMINFLTLDRNFKNLSSKTHEFGFDAIKYCPKSYSIEYQLNDNLYIIYHTECLYPTNKTLIYNINIGNVQNISGNFTSDYTRLFVKSKEGEIHHILDYNGIKIVTTNYELEVLSTLEIPNAGNKLIFADSLNNGINLVSKKKDNSYQYFSISSENTINYEKSFSLDTNITLTNIKSVNENLILMHGYYNDKANKTNYAYFGKYHPMDNTLQDTILYSRKDIRKIERVNNSTYAAIGQSRGRQGYLLLDTNLHQIKDIRVDSLTGEIKDMLLHDKKVYLFTEKIVSLPTMALGAKESFQTTASVIGLPEDILLSAEDSPIIFTDKLTHSAYPNPTSEVLNLKVLTNESANYTIKLYNIYGTEILNIHDGFIPAHTEKIFSIPTSLLSIGSYYYVISGGGIVERGKVMVVR